MSPTIFCDCHCKLGEGVLWHPVEQVVYFVDIDRGQLYRDGQVVLEDDPIGSFTFQQDGALLLFGQAGRVKRWHQGNLSLVAELPAERHTRFNDAIASPDGHAFAGTLPSDDQPGKLYRFDPDGSHRVVLQDLAQPNGMGFSPDGHWFYLTESHRQTIHRFAYRDGEISEPTALVVTEGLPGVPDGLTVDAEGHLWSARWDGGAAIRYAPDGREERRVEFPASKITCVAFGGQQLDRLFATSADGGPVFETRVGVRGQREYFSRVAVGEPV